MIETTYFARISSQSSATNNLQKAITSHFLKYDNFLLSDPAELCKLLQGLTDQASRNNRRCIAMSAHVQDDWQTKRISSITVTNLITLRFHAIAGTFGTLSTQHPAIATPVPEAIDKPRQAILSRREGGKEERLEYWFRFSVRVQTLLREGRIWNIYRDNENQLVAEEYGGIIHPAF